MLVVDQSSRAHEHVVLRSMFAARKHIFVDLLQWDLPVLGDRFEVDDRDGPGATYLIVADEGGGHLASARLLQAQAASLRALSGDTGARPLGAPGVAEVTHLCVSPDIELAERRRARNRLLHGLVEHALANRIRHFIGIAEEPSARRIERLGWACRRLGVVPAGCGRSAVAVAVDVDPTTPGRLVAAGTVRPAATGRFSS